MILNRYGSSVYVLIHTKDCEDRTTQGFRHDNCLCECHDRGKYTGNKEPKE